MLPKTPPLTLSAADSRQFLTAVFALVLGRRAARAAGHPQADPAAYTDADAVRIAADIRLAIQRIYPNLY